MLHLPHSRKLKFLCVTYIWSFGFAFTSNYIFPSTSLRRTRSRFAIPNLWAVATAAAAAGGGDGASSAETIPISKDLTVLTGVRDIADNYDVFLLDMWGVMHDGSKTYEGVLETVKELRAAGKDMIILSNSSKRKSNSVQMLTKLGFDPSRDFSQIITSGEVTFQLLSGISPSSPEASLAPAPWNRLQEILDGKHCSDSKKKKAFCFGSGDEDEEYINSCGWSLAPIDEANLIVARGTFTIQGSSDCHDIIHKTDDGEDIYFKTYHEQLRKAAKRRIPMLVANPDKIRPDKDRSPMPGTIGRDYEEALRKEGIVESSSLVKYIGKPFADVYDVALKGKDISRVCMIGDALETDCLGGSKNGIDTIWVVGNGIHNDDIQKEGNGELKAGCTHVLQKFNEMSSTYAEGTQIHPTVVLSHFKW